jgi:lysophospholipase L1-like esterase/type 1 glutamine amidotransferase
MRKTLIALAVGWAASWGLVAVGAAETARATPGGAGVAAEPISTLVLTGHNNHNWAFTSRVHAETLEATGRFRVRISDDPAATLSDAEAVRGVGLFVLDYNDLHAPRRWGEAAERALVKAVREGAGLVAIHSANNAFRGWAEYEQMLGPVWRDKAGHGPFRGLSVSIARREHPIFAGWPAGFETSDELYHGLENVAAVPTEVLALAMDKAEGGGSGREEPVAMTLTFGRGRVFATPLGHVWTDQPETKQSVLSPAFRAMLARGAEWAATGQVTLAVSWTDRREHNALSAEERSAGWTLLFDGQKATGLRGYKQAGFPDRGWAAVDGTLRHAAKGNGGDICTSEIYGDFEFECEWRVSPGGNSGIMYRCSEQMQYPWQTGREMQILDDQRHQDGRKPKTRAGTMYDLFACAADVARPAEEWNHARVVAQGSRLQHWLNHVRVVDTDAASEDYAKALAASKFTTMKDFGVPREGVVALQDHGDEVWFRNIKIRRLAPGQAASPPRFAVAGAERDGPPPAGAGKSAEPKEGAKDASKESPKADAPHSAVLPARRGEAWWGTRFDLLNTRCEGPGRVVFIGDSITQGWEGEGQKAWKEQIEPLGAVNLGIGGDRTQNVLWRLRNGHVQRLRDPARPGGLPRVFVVMIGTNNSNGQDNTAEEIADGIRAIVAELRTAFPDAWVLLLDIFPRGEKPNAQREKNARASALAAQAFAGDNRVRREDLGPRFLAEDGTLSKALFPDLLHLSPGAYERWAEAIAPWLRATLDRKPTKSGRRRRRRGGAGEPLFARTGARVG